LEFVLVGIRTRITKAQNLWLRLCFVLCNDRSDVSPTRFRASTKSYVN
jgi:hypothetical protein